MSIITLGAQKLRRFHMNTLEEYQRDFGDSAAVELEYYETFLIRTDYIVVKMAEAKLLGQNDIPPENEVFECRARARERINELQVQLSENK